MNPIQNQISRLCNSPSNGEPELTGLVESITAVQATAWSNNGNQITFEQTTQLALAWDVSAAGKDRTRRCGWSVAAVTCSTVTCFLCGKKGHKKAVCPQRERSGDSRKRKVMAFFAPRSKEGQDE